MTAAGLTPATLLVFALALAFGGAVSGFFAGLLGIGGGAVVVLVLYQAMEVLDVDAAVRMHVAVGTTLAVIVPTSIRSFLAHRARGAVDESVLRRWVLPVTAGVLLGSAAASLASGAALIWVFVVLTLLNALRMVFAGPVRRPGASLPGQPLLSLYGVAIGFLSVLMGIGGGALSTMAMTLHGRSIHQAVATSAGVGVLVSVPGMLGFIAGGWGEPGLPPFSLGYVNLAGAALVAPVAMAVAPLGVRAAHALSRRRLELIFAAFLAVICLRFAYDLL